MVLRESVHEIVDKISEDGLAEIVNFLEYLWIKDQSESVTEIINDQKIPDSIQTELTEYKMNGFVDFESIPEEVYD